MNKPMTTAMFCMALLLGGLSSCTTNDVEDIQGDGEQDLYEIKDRALGEYLVYNCSRTDENKLPYEMAVAENGKFYLNTQKAATVENLYLVKNDAFGNLSLSLQEACFYNEQQEKLKLTPMQYTLMEMFYLSSSHLLFKSDICQSLWPGKDNADETLYTLIRRLKPIVEDNSNLRITTDRGRAYGLEIKT